ncbi:MAG: hypothetical protein HYX67_04285 [Candidatus Melainabacteria bacterium]|nr:hypothetical protein [Candidatus Melainabacteria bacterium]
MTQDYQLDAKQAVRILNEALATKIMCTDSLFAVAPDTGKPQPSGSIPEKKLGPKQANDEANSLAER